MIFGLFARRKEEAAVEALYRRVASAGRAPALYLEYGVPDTPERRFELLALHVFLVLHRLRSLPTPAADVAQDLVDVTFRELDRSLRQMGVGDISVPKRIKVLAQAFYGRIEAYDRGLESLAAGGTEEALVASLARHVVCDGHAAKKLAAYVRRANETLAKRGLADILGSDPLFPDPAGKKGSG